MELNALLPIEQRPEYTEGYEGFYHVIGFGGTVEEATLRYIIRDHFRDRFEEKKAFMQNAWISSTKNMATERPAQK
jgi:tripeptide aminopeptidase